MLISVAALGAGILLARTGQPATPTTTQGGRERNAYLGTYPVGQLPSSRQLAEQQVAAGVFQPSDVEALTTAIEARRYAVGQTPGTHKLYPYESSPGVMVDVGSLTQNGNRSPLAYVTYPVEGSPTQGTWRPI